MAAINGCDEFFHGFSIPYIGVHRQTDKKEKRFGRFMNGQQGSDVVPGTGRDMLTAEGGGIMRGFFWKTSWNAGRGEWSGVEDGWMKG